MTDRDMGMGRDKQGGVKPGFSAHLPKCFMYKKEMSGEAVTNIIRYLAEYQLWGFAVTAHPFDREGKVSLWMNRRCVEFLVQDGILRFEGISETRPFERR